MIKRFSPGRVPETRLLVFGLINVTLGGILKYLKHIRISAVKEKY